MGLGKDLTSQEQGKAAALSLAGRTSAKITKGLE